MISEVTASKVEGRLTMNAARTAAIMTTIGSRTSAVRISMNEVCEESQKVHRTGGLHKANPYSMLTLEKPMIAISMTAAIAMVIPP